MWWTSLSLSFFVLFLLQDHIFGYSKKCPPFRSFPSSGPYIFVYKNFPLFKTFPLSPKFLFQTLFFSKISSSLTFSNEWQNSNLLDLSWTISITYTPAGIKICLLLWIFYWAQNLKLCWVWLFITTKYIPWRLESKKTSSRGPPQWPAHSSIVSKLLVFPPQPPYENNWQRPSLLSK